MNNLYTKNNYLNKNLTFIKNTFITEYDMSSAGLNILTELGYFSLEDRDKLLKLDKLERNVIIGKLLKKDKKMITDLEYGFSEARRIFFEKNNIHEEDVLAIKRDAIFIIGNKKIDENISNLIKIRPKKIYTTYINILGYEHYYNNDTYDLDVKGYDKKVVEIHKNCLFNDLKSILRSEEVNDKIEVYKKLAILKDKLISYNLPKGYYFDIIRSSYLVNFDNYEHFALEDISDEDIKEEIVFYYNNMNYINGIIGQLL